MQEVIREYLEKAKVGRKQVYKNMAVFPLLSDYSLNSDYILLCIQKMKEAMVAAGLREPAFASDAVFRATFQRSPEFALKDGKGKGVREKLGEGAEELVEKLGEKLAENERHILRLIHSNRRISIKDMAKEVGISTTAVHKNLTKLKQRGILRRVGPDKGGHWEVVR